jgi:hypothetical protein|tara:strand:+ start:92 stop:430 length:339 start_codon:yes stop_codon:yes gene_type:complete
VAEKVDTQNELFQQCRHIADQIESGEYESSNEDEPQGAFDYLSDALDIEYTVDSKGEYLGARVLVAFGGPNIWINTRHKTVEGYWWSDRAEANYFEDKLGLDDALEELWSMR